MNKVIIMGMYQVDTSPENVDVEIEEEEECMSGWVGPLLRLFKMVEDGPLGRTRMSNWVSFDNRGMAIRFRACSGRPCQRPGPLLAPSLESRVFIEN